MLAWAFLATVAAMTLGVQATFNCSKTEITDSDFVGNLLEIVDCQATEVGASVEQSTSLSGRHIVFKNSIVRSLLVIVPSGTASDFNITFEGVWIARNVLVMGSPASKVSNIRVVLSGTGTIQPAQQPPPAPTLDFFSFTVPVDGFYVEVTPDAIVRIVALPASGLMNMHFFYFLRRRLPRGPALTRLGSRRHFAGNFLVGYFLQTADGVNSLVLSNSSFQVSAAVVEVFDTHTTSRYPVSFSSHGNGSRSYGRFRH
jgi:hypothetical protein